MTENYNYRHKYEKLKELHLEVTQENLKIKKELHDLYIEKNKISNELEHYKRLLRHNPELTQTKKVFDVLATLINNKESCSYRYLIYDLLGFDKSAYGSLLSGMTVTNFLVECFDEGKYHD